MKWLVVVMSLALAILCEALLALAYEPSLLLYAVRAMFSCLVVCAGIVALEGKKA